MKCRDSGMPEEAYWESLFDVEGVLSGLGLDKAVHSVAEMGCGYGTFTIPIAQRVSGAVHGFDIDPEMLARTQARAEAAGLANVRLHHRDVMQIGFGLAAERVDAVLLFNILHCEAPSVLLQHALAAATDGGRILVIHWRCDGATPRGPSLDIRPTPEEICGWAESLGRLKLARPVLDLPPWHYGIVFRVSSNNAP